MEKVLILGGSHRDIPLINAAKELGLFVITLANRNDYIGHNYADKFYKVDFNNFEEIKNIINKEKIKHLIPGCGEASYINTVVLSRELKTGSFDLLQTAKLLHNKWKFKKFCLENGICTPNGFLYNNNASLSDINFPVVMKPTQLSGGNGVSIVNTQDELLEQLKITQKVSNEIFIEEHIEGELIAYSVFLKDQKIIYSFSGKDDPGLNPYLITKAYPISLNKNIEQKICLDIETIAKKLNLIDGMFHLQIIIKDQLPYIIDVTRRIPGDLYPWLMEYCDGVKYSKAVVKAYLGKEINNEFSNKNQNQNFVVRYVVMPNQNGIFKNIIIDSVLQDKIMYKLDLVEQNTPIDNYLTAKLAIVFIQLQSYDKNLIKNLSNFIVLNTKQEDRVSNMKNYLKSNIITIYGAGAFGKSFHKALDGNIDCSIDDYSKEEELFKKPIKKISQIDKNTTIYISVLQHSKKIENDLVSSGYKNVFGFSEAVKLMPKILQIISQTNYLWLVQDKERMVNTEQLNKVKDFLVDSKSKTILNKLIHLRKTLDVKYYINPQDIEYFPSDVPILKNLGKINFIDCGAYTGDTIEELILQTSHVKTTISFEPDTKNLASLQTQLSLLKDKYQDINFLVYPAGVYSSNTILTFANNGVDSSVSIVNTSDVQIPVVSLDSVILNFNPNFIKMDIEGAEKEALIGAAKTIQKYKLNLAICLYHKPQDLWELPLLIQEIEPSYDMYIRVHEDMCLSTVLYCISRSRDV